jgi:hypothetical protein
MIGTATPRMEKPNHTRMEQQTMKTESVTDGGALVEWNEHTDIADNGEAELATFLGGTVTYDYERACLVWNPIAPHEWLVVELFATADNSGAGYNEFETTVVESWRELATWCGNDEKAGNGCTILKRCDGGITVLVNAPRHGGTWKAFATNFAGTIRGGTVAFRIRAFANDSEPIRVGEFLVKPPCAFGERADIADNLAAWLLPYADMSKGATARMFLGNHEAAGAFSETLFAELLLRFQLEGQVLVDLCPPELIARALGVAQYRYEHVELVARSVPTIGQRLSAAWKLDTWRTRLRRITDFVPPLPGALYWLFEQLEPRKALELRNNAQAHYNAQLTTDELAAGSTAITKSKSLPLQAVEVVSEQDLFGEIAKRLADDFRYLPELNTWAYFRTTATAVGKPDDPGVWRLGAEADTELLRAVVAQFEQLQPIPSKRTLAVAKSVVCLLKTELAALPPFSFDATPHLFGIGTPDAPRTHDLLQNTSRPMVRSDFISKLTNLQPASDDVLEDGYPAEQWKRWKKFLLDIHSNGTPGFGEAQVEMVRAAFGAACFGVTGDQVPILQGTGGNGKGVLLDTAALAFGDYAGTLDHRALFDPKAHPSGLNGLRGLRFVSVNEPEATNREPWSMAQLKAFTGGNLITTRAMHADAGRHYLPTASLFVNTNDFPEILNPGNAERRRLVRVVYPNNYPESALFKKSILELAAVALRDFLNAAYEVGQRRANGAPSIVITEAMAHSTSDWLGDTNDTYAVVRMVLMVGDMKNDFITPGELVRVVNRCANNLNGVDDDGARYQTSRKAVSKAIAKLFNEGRDFTYSRGRVGTSQPYGWHGLRFAPGYAPHELDSTFGTNRTYIPL